MWNCEKHRNLGISDFRDCVICSQETDYLRTLDTHKEKCNISTSSKVKSDGGSTSYYEYEVPEKGKQQVFEFIMYALDNDFDLGNIAKAIRRVSENKAGRGKEGTSIEYDLNKIIYTVKKLKKILCK